LHRFNLHCLTMFASAAAAAAVDVLAAAAAVMAAKAAAVAAPAGLTLVEAAQVGFQSEA
jgi:hypothetical protein